MEITGWITLAAVIVALGIGVASILHTQSLQQRERKERLLNEIIEWAIDAAKPTYALTLTSLDYTLSEEDQTTIMQLSQASHTDTLIARGKYIGKIALIFTKDLSFAVENVRNNLEKHSKLIEDWVNGKGNAKAIGAHDYTLGQSANKVIEEAAKIKTRDIG